jgi:hypothetical protein
MDGMQRYEGARLRSAAEVETAEIVTARINVSTRVFLIELTGLKLASPRHLNAPFLWPVFDGELSIQVGIRQ